MKGDHVKRLKFIYSHDAYFEVYLQENIHHAAPSMEEKFNLWY